MVDVPPDLLRCCCQFGWQPSGQQKVYEIIDSQWYFEENMLLYLLLEWDH